MKRVFLCAITLLFILGMAAFSPTSYAEPILQGSLAGGVWSVDDGTRSAIASFEVVSTTLSIILTNTAATTSAPNEVLGGIFFDYSVGLINPTVSLATGSVLLIETGADPYTLDNFDGEWGVLTGIAGSNKTGADFVISSTSLDPEPVSPAPDGWEGIGADALIAPGQAIVPPAPNGVDFGLIGGGVSGGWIPDYLVQSAVKIEWTIEGDDPGMASNVWFAYGTDYEIPEPAAMLLIGAGLIGLAVFSRRLSKKA